MGSKIQICIAPVIGLEKTKCDEIDKPVLAQCLPETGININFPRDVVLGFTLYGGLQWESLYTIQPYEKIRFFLKNVRTQSRLGKLIRILVETSQLSTGIKQNILNKNINWPS